MTMLIAGHETTAAVLTWAVFLLAQVCFTLQIQFPHVTMNMNLLLFKTCYFYQYKSVQCVTELNICHISLMQHPSKMQKAQAEIDSVLGDGAITYESLKKLE